MRKKNAAALIAATNNDGIWQSDAVNGLGALRVLIREGQPLNGKTVTSFNVLKASIGSVGVPRSFNNRSTITALVTYTDGGTAIVVIAFPSLFDSVRVPDHRGGLTKSRSGLRRCRYRAWRLGGGGE